MASASEKKKSKPKKSNKNADKIDASPLNKIIYSFKYFFNDIECIKEMYQIVMPVLIKNDDVRRKRLQSITENISSLKSTRKTDVIEITSDDNRFLNEFKNLQETVLKLNKANRLFRQNSIIMLVARYDQFLSEVLASIFRSRPDRLKTSNKTISYEDIINVTSIDDAISKFIEKEVDDIMRESHADQIKYLDNQLKLGLRENMSCWDHFIELTERRNLFAHTDGRINKQYLEVCKQHKIKMDDKSKIGSILKVDEDYFDKSLKCLFEIACRTVQSVLRRLFPDKLNEADSALNELGFKLLQENQWELAGIVFLFALNIPQKLIYSDEYYRMFIINYCIALKGMGETSEINGYLSTIDWSAANPKFILAVHILKKEYSLAGKAMESMNGKDPIDEPAFRTWPIFKDFRNTKHFKQAFKKIYKRDYRPQIERKVNIDDELEPNQK